MSLTDPARPSPGELLAALGELEAGNPETKAQATITSGLRGGMVRPRRRRPGAA